jgi:hypothetical protein
MAGDDEDFGKPQTKAGTQNDFGPPGPERSRSRSREKPDEGFAHPKRRSGGGKLARSETVTVRLDPKLRYFAELAARKQRRTLSSFIECAIEESLKKIELFDDRTRVNVTLASQANELWDVDEPDRFAKLAKRFPHMLTHDEQVVWKLVCENGSFWWRDIGGGWSIHENSLVSERLREHWKNLWAVARGSADKAVLPDWE